MKELIGFPMGNDNIVWIEVEATGSRRGEREVSNKKLRKKSEKEFHEALENVKPISEAILNTLRQLSANPDEIEVDFGLKMDIKAGAIIASTGLEANFNVKLKWKGV